MVRLQRPPLGNATEHGPLPEASREGQRRTGQRRKAQPQRGEGGHELDRAGPEHAGAGARQDRAMSGPPLEQHAEESWRLRGCSWKICSLSTSPCCSGVPPRPCR